MVFKIYGTSESADTNPRRVWYWIADVKNSSIARKIAKKASKMKMWHEVEVCGFEKDGELIYHSYWRDGKLEIDMAI